MIGAGSLNAGFLRVLVVDGDPDVRTIVRLALGLDPGMDVQEAGSGHAALRLLGSGMKPNVVMLDTHLPDLTGEEVAHLIRCIDHPAAPPIIFLTAAARGKDVASLLAAGAVGVITKPFDPLSLPVEVRGILHYDAARH